MPFRSLPDTISETILEAFGLPLGSLGEPLWRKKRIRRGIQKMERKTGVRGIPSNPGNDPVCPYKESFLEPCNLVKTPSWEPGTLDPRLGGLIALHFVLRSLGHGGGFYSTW